MVSARHTGSISLRVASYPSRIHFALFSLEELARYVICSRDPDWTAWFLRRLADRKLSERRRRAIGILLASTAKSRASAPLARDVWLAGRDLWDEARKPTVAVLACEAAAWLRDQATFDDALAVGSRLFTSAAKARLQFLREVYLNEPIAGVPRLIPLPALLAHDGLLHYVDDYARARAADSQGRVDVALEYYKRALASLPRNHSAYEFAVGRCNTIINMKAVN